MREENEYTVCGRHGIRYLRQYASHCPMCEVEMSRQYEYMDMMEDQFGVPEPMEFRGE